MKRRHFLTTSGKLLAAVAGTSVLKACHTEEDMIGEPEERVHLRESEQAFRDLAAVGPFWRAPTPTPAATEPA